MIEKTWYIAEVVLEIKVEGDSRNVVHRNLMLIQAASSQEAYQSAIKLGQDNEITYENPAGQLVRISYRGISKLDIIDDHLDHGAELLYEEIVGVPDKIISQMICPKEKLALFRPIKATEGPDYRSKDIVDEAQELLNDVSRSE